MSVLVSPGPSKSLGEVLSFEGPACASDANLYLLLVTNRKRLSVEFEIASN
jgi:hypothetical protein